MSPRLRRAAFGLGTLLIGAVFVFGWARHQKIPLRKVFNPAQWVLHWQGRDHYDPRQALLQEGDPDRREVALTFDDGPDPRYGPQIAAILTSKHVSATFFLVGMRVKEHPEVARLLARDGFELANHTYNHQDLPALKPHQIASELRLCDADVYAATGEHTTLMRPPGVQYNDKVLDVAKSLGYVTVSWTVGARDYEADTTAAFIQDRVLDRTAPGAIILLHQDTPATAGALPGIIDSLRAQGYAFVTISQMLDHLGARRPQTKSPIKTPTPPSSQTKPTILTDT